MRTKIYYAAMLKNNKYKVHEIKLIPGCPVEYIRPLANCRAFDTFAEADQVALDIAKGIYDWPKGQYINMR
jgi:hypothetical protein